MAQQTNIMSVLALIFAILLPLLGLIFSIIALVQHKRNPKLAGKGLAIAGLIISIVFLIIGLVFLIGLLLFLSVAGVSMTAM